MTKKFISVIIVPHTKTSCRTISFSRKALRLLTSGVIVFFAALLVFLVDYFSMGLIRSRYKMLVREFEHQKSQLVSYENSIKDLQAAIANFESYTKKLNVMAGLRSPDVLSSPAGLGSGAQESIASGTQSHSQVVLQNLSQKAESIDRNLNGLVSFFEIQRTRLASTPSIMPVAGWLSSSFGNRVDPFTGRMQFHAGIDISTNSGNQVAASADGIVINVSQDRMLGKNVSISHGYGIVTVYAHLSGFAVKEGQKVKRGDVIGYVGMTGKALGPHLHYEVRVNDKPVNPLNYILEE